MRVLLHKISQQHYEELYESQADGTTSLQEDINEVLKAFSTSKQTLIHLRYVWMTLILIVVVEPTIEYYQPSNLLPKDIRQQIVSWLLNTINQLINSENTYTQFSIEKVSDKNLEINTFHFSKEVANIQAVNEALDVFYNALRVLDYNQAIAAILEILDDCLEGYAIFPGSYGRRELFDWWLLEVVPASWKLLPPRSFYVVEGLQHKEDIIFRQTKFLKQISDNIWYKLLYKFGMGKEVRNSYIDYSNKYTNIHNTVFMHSISNLK
jgi:hypothetical protein